MERKFKDKKIVILSPQPWNHLFISKHHYAKELAKQNDVYYVSPPSHKWILDFTVKIIEKRLSLINFSVLVPDLVKFKFPKLYKSIVKRRLRKILAQEVGVADFSIDFGCYQFFDSIDFFPAHFKIFFPVDDSINVKGLMRGANIVFTVSKKIQEKFPLYTCHFINHGLSDDFVKKAQQKSIEIEPWKPSSKINVGYAGNLFMRFLNFEVFEAIITENPSVHFHLFGEAVRGEQNPTTHRWSNFLKSAHNVTLHGMIEPAKLVESYQEIDLFMLCYQPDNLNYHGENSHKILEYLSTGKVTVSSSISLYRDTNLLEMEERDKPLQKVFKEVVNNLAFYNSSNKMKKRRDFALSNSYEKQLQRMEKIIAQEFLDL